MRNCSLIRALRAECHEVVILAFGNEAEAAAARSGLAGLCEDIEVIGEVKRPANHGRLGALFSRLPYGAWRMRSPRMRQAVSERLAREHFDLVLCDDIYLFENLPKASPVPVILNKHTIVTEEFERFVQRQRNPCIAAYGWSECRRLRRLECAACSNVGAVWACSERDRQILLRYNHAVPVAVVPNVVDVAEYKATENDDGRTVVYVGAMDWLPNRDAVEFFVFNVMPELRRLRPEARFVVAGREPPSAFRKRLERVPGVSFTGTLPDLRPQIGQAAVCAVPLRIGSGTRLKIIEAAAMAKAVVSTTIGAEGLSLKDRVEIIIADEPKEFAREIATLLADRQRRLKLGQAARKHVNAQYGIPALRRSLREALNFMRDQRHVLDTAAG